MATKQSMWIIFVILLTSAWILGSTIQAGAETLKCKSELKLDVRADEQVESTYTSGYFIGVNTRQGLAICENGETADIKSYALWNADWPEECLTSGITIYTFKDFSKIITKADFRQTRDPKGEAEWLWEGTGEVIKGTTRFKGIKGGVTFKGKQVPPDKKAINELTITYTLPPK
jgi:hypothetical protein